MDEERNEMDNFPTLDTEAAMAVFKKESHHPQR